MDHAYYYVSLQFWHIWGGHFLDVWDVSNIDTVCTPLKFLLPIHKIHFEKIGKSSKQNTLEYKENSVNVFCVKMSFSSKTCCCCSATLLYLNTSRASDKFCANVSCFSSISCSSCWCILNRITVFSKEQFLYSIHFNYILTHSRKQLLLKSYILNSRPTEVTWGHDEVINCH